MNVRTVPAIVPPLTASAARTEERGEGGPIEESSMVQAEQVKVKVKVKVKVRECEG